MRVVIASSTIPLPKPIKNRGGASCQCWGAANQLNSTVLSRLQNGQFIVLWCERLIPPARTSNPSAAPAKPGDRFCQTIRPSASAAVDPRVSDQISHERIQGLKFTSKPP